MTGVPVLQELHVECLGATLRMSWKWARPAAPTMRVMRSSRCACGSPDEHLSGESGQTLVYEGAQAGLVDLSAPQDDDLFYTVFARRRDPHASWRRPVWVWVHRRGYQPQALGLPSSGDSTAIADHYVRETLAGERFVEIKGDTEDAPAIQGPRDLVHIAIPIALVVALACFLMGVDRRLITVVALTLAIGGRLTDGERPDFRRFLTFLAIPAAATVFIFLATAIMYFFSANLPTALDIRPSQLLAPLYPAVLLVAVAAVWVFSGRLGRDSQDRQWWWALVVGLVALGAVIPLAGCALAVVLGGLDYRSDAKRWRQTARERGAALQAQREALTRRVYTPWLDAEDETK